MDECGQQRRGAPGAGGRMVRSLGELLDRIEAAVESDSVSLGDILDQVGRRSFGPLLLLPGLIMAAPVVGDIPGVPTMMGLFVILVSAQVLTGHEHFWLPEFLQRRTVAVDKLCKALGWMRPVARFVDRCSKPRMTTLVGHAGIFVAAAACIVIAAATPLMEVVPFVANFAGAAITVYGLALIAHDGLLALFAIAFSSAVAVLLVTNLA